MDKKKNQTDGGENQVSPLTVLERDNWTCALCKYTAPEGSDVPMYSEHICLDESIPSSYITLCEGCHDEQIEELLEEGVTSYEQIGDSEEEKKAKEASVNRTTYDPDSFSTRFTRNLLAQIIYLPGMIMGLGLIFAGMTILNPLRMAGMSSWPPVHPEKDAIPLTLYLRDVFISAPQLLIVGVVIAVITTQLTIWYEHRNGPVTRITKWTISKIR